MSVTYGFFNSVGDPPDRVYDADDLGRLFDGILTDGVFATYGNMFKVTAAGQSNKVLVGTGKGWFKHTWIENADQALSLTLPAPSTSLSRYDAIVLDINKSTAVRANSITYVSGTAALNPSLPTLINDDAGQHWQFLIAAVKRRANVSTPTSSDITQYVGETGGAPIAAGTVTPVSDSEMSDTSINPVQNRVIKRYVDAMQPDLLKLLWVNANTGSSQSFAEQTITFSTSGYTHYIIDTYGDSSFIVSVNGNNNNYLFGHRLTWHSGSGALFRRTLRAYSNKIAFDDALLFTMPESEVADTDNGYLIPLRIYGFKMEMAL